MQVIHIDSINPNLKKFLFESRKMILKYSSLDFNYRCYTKYLDTSYQYYTMIPDALYDNIPFDILTRCVEYNKLLSYILIGNYAIIDNNNNLYNNLIVYNQTEGNYTKNSPIFTIAKLKLLKEYYSEKKLDDDIISKILGLREKFDRELDGSLASKFDYEYYQYYALVEKLRKQRVECSLLGEEINKIYIR